MFTEGGAQFVIVGHSERRTKFGETDERVNLKVQAALKNDLRPVICVGETLAQREDGLADGVIKNQVMSALKNINKIDACDVIIAYEPLWAINTGKSCDPEEAQRVCSMIRKTLTEKYGSNTAEDVSILYGGSVNDENADSYFSTRDIDGALVGGACLDSEKFLGIVESLKNKKSYGTDSNYLLP